MSDPGVDPAEKAAVESEPAASSASLETDTDAPTPLEAKAAVSPAPQQAEPRSGRRVWLWIAIAVAGLAVIGVVVAMQGGRGSKPATVTEKTTSAATTPAPSTPTAPLPAGTTAVPRVVGLSKDAAEGKLKTTGFAPLVTTVVTSTAAAGSIVAQTPDAGSGLVAGSPVALGVAQADPPDSSQSVPSPNVYQMTKSQAQSVLLNAELIPYFIYTPSDQPKGLVITQGPIASEPVPVGGAVIVALSTGVAPKLASVTIPDVVGASQADAVSALKAAGLACQIVQGPNATTPKGSVFRQMPQAGGLVGADMPVAIAVSLGPVPSGSIVTVPNVKGMDAAAAVQTLADAGLIVQRGDVNDMQTAPGKVTGQMPLEGWTVPSGSVAIIMVAVAP